MEPHFAPFVYCRLAACARHASQSAMMPSILDKAFKGEL